jgi:hypothetical protein
MRTVAGLAPRCVLALLCCVLRPAAAWAQDTASRLEAGGHITVARLTAAPRTPGFGASIDVNLSRVLAIESRITRLSEPDGTAIHVAAGVRATLIRARRLSMYGVALPGLYHLATPPPLGAIIFLLDGSVGDPVNIVGGSGSQPATRFVLDLGAGAGFSLTSRLTAHVELDRDLHAYRDTVLTGPAGSSSSQSSFPNDIGSRWNLQVGASYRMGSTVARQAARPTAGRWTMGLQVGETISTGADGIGTVGAFASYAVWPHVDVDTSASAFVRDSLVSSVYEGGRALQGVAGVKLGVREGRFGVFFKARTGVNSYSKVFRTDPMPVLVRSTVAVLDIGGIVETYFARRCLLRIDVGETLSFAPSVTLGLVPLSPRSPPPYEVERKQIYSLPIRVGIGWRF